LKTKPFSAEVPFPRHPWPVIRGNAQDEVHFGTTGTSPILSPQTAEQAMDGSSDGGAPTLLFHARLGEPCYGRTVSTARRPTSLYAPVKVRIRLLLFDLSCGCLAALFLGLHAEKKQVEKTPP